MVLHVNLPMEILLRIIDQLEHNRDFQSLFSCALTGKLLARNALKSLYRIHTHSRIFCSSDSFEEYFGTRKRTCERFNRGKNIEFSSLYSNELPYIPLKVILWKSIILSSIGETTFPYYLFIRSLDFDQLGFLIRSRLSRPVGPLNSLFVEDMFLGRYEQSSTLNPEAATLSTAQSNNFTHTYEVVDLVGEHLICEISKAPRTAVNLERIKWRHNNKALTRWINRLSNLKTLVISSPLNPKDLAKTISQYCPELRNLVIFSSCRGDDQEDQARAFFLNGLKKDTLQKIFIKDYSNSLFDVISSEACETISSLSSHAESLTELKISQLSLIATKRLHLLGACKALTSLQLSFQLDRNYTFELKKTDHDLFQAIVDWICSCRSLHELSLGNSDDATAILTQVCSKDWTRLQKLEVIQPNCNVDADFFKALSTQSTLEFLCLGQNLINSTSDDIHNFTVSLGCLASLKHLDIRTVSGFYQMDTMITLVSYLPRLAEFFFTCDGTTDALWPSMENLRHLRILTIQGFSYFSFNGILAFVDTLHTTNKGFELSIWAQHKSTCITREQIVAIAKSLSAKVGGCLEIVNDCSEFYKIFMDMYQLE